MTHNKTKVEVLKAEDRYSYGIKVTTFHRFSGEQKDEFIIPVIDVRDGDEHRRAAEKLERAGNAVKGSKFIKPTFSWYGINYNTSTKKTKE